MKAIGRRSELSGWSRNLAGIRWSSADSVNLFHGVGRGVSSDLAGDFRMRPTLRN